MVALLAIVLAGTPIAAAAIGTGGGAHASKVVPHVKFAPKVSRANHAKGASNTNRLDGFRATQTPTPDTLLPLDANGHFPPSVVPNIGIGPPGPRGPAGRVGQSGNFTSQVVPDPANGAQVQACTGTSTGAAGQGSVASAVCGCPLSQPVVGGGFKNISAQQLPNGQRLGDNGFDIVLQNQPVVNADGTTAWKVTVKNIPSGTPQLLVVQAYAICGTL